MNSVGRIQTADTTVMPRFWWIFVVPEPCTTAIYCYVVIFTGTKNALETPFGFSGWIFENAPVIEVEGDDIVFPASLGSR